MHTKDTLGKLSKTLNKMGDDYLIKNEEKQKCWMMENVWYPTIIRLKAFRRARYLLIYRII